MVSSETRNALFGLIAFAILISLLLCGIWFISVTTQECRDITIADKWVHHSDDSTEYRISDTEGVVYYTRSSRAYDIFEVGESYRVHILYNYRDKPLAILSWSEIRS